MRLYHRNRRRELCTLYKYAAAWDNARPFHFAGTMQAGKLHSTYIIITINSVLIKSCSLASSGQGQLISTIRWIRTIVDYRHNPATVALKFDTVYASERGNFETPTYCNSIL